MGTFALAYIDGYPLLVRTVPLAVCLAPAPVV